MKCYLKTLAVALLVFLILFFTGCVEEKDPVTIVKELPQVEEFLAEHPNAKIAATKLTAETVGLRISDIQEDCGQAMKVQDYWYVAIFEGDEKVEVYIDATTNKSVCIVKGVGALEISQDLNGYIVQFENEPIIVRKNRLEKETKELANVPLNETQIAEKLRAYSKYLDGENKKVKEKILPESAEKIARIENEFKNVFNGIFLLTTKEVAEEIKKIPGVKAVYPNLEVHATLMDSIPLIQEGIEAGKLDADGTDCSISGKPCLTGKGVTIAILDSGIDYTHADLGGCFGTGCKVKGGYDFINYDNDPMDDFGHGTHVAGIAAGSGQGGLKGVASEAKLYSYKVLNSNGDGWWSEIIAAIDRAVDPNQDGNFDDKVDIISMSIGGATAGAEPDDPVSQAVDIAVDAGVIVVVAAGNGGPGSRSISSPGTARKAITVGATYKKNYSPFWFDCTPRENTVCGICNDEGKVLCNGFYNDENPQTDQVTFFSSRGPVGYAPEIIFKPDLVAPGAIICSARHDDIFREGLNPYKRPCLDEKHLTWAGTSMSTPMVAGAAALIKQAHSDWSPEEIKQALKSTAFDVGADMDAQGYGRMDVAKAVGLKNAPLVAKLDPIKMEDVVDITGTAKGEGFDYYKVLYAEKSSHTWNLICMGDKPVEDGVLCADFNLRSLENGNYYFKLEAYDESDQLTYFKFPVSVLLPIVEITKPQDNSSYSIGDSINVVGTIELRWTYGYEIEFKKKEDLSWSARGVQITNYCIYPGCRDPIKNDLLAIWDTTELSEGVYDLKLTVYDMVGRHRYEIYAAGIQLLPLPQCIDNDGKCPESCDPGNDRDCFTPGITGLREGERLIGLRGTYNYIGLNNLEIELDTIMRPTSGVYYTAMFRVYNENNLIDSKMGSALTNLNEYFVDGSGKRVLRDMVKVTKIGQGAKSGVGYVEIEIAPLEDNLWAEGETRSGFRGTGNYAGQNNLKIKLAGITQITSYYVAIFELYNEQGNLISSTDVRIEKAANLKEYLLDQNGQYVLQDNVLIKNIFFSPITGVYFEVEIKEIEKLTLTEGDEIRNLKGRGNYAGQNDLYLKLRSVLMPNYEAIFDLYNGQGTLIGSAIERANTELRDIFFEGGNYVLEDSIVIKSIRIYPATSVVYVNVELNRH